MRYTEHTKRRFETLARPVLEQVREMVKDKTYVQSGKLAQKLDCYPQRVSAALILLGWKRWTTSFGNRRGSTYKRVAQD